MEADDEAMDEEIREIRENVASLTDAWLADASGEYLVKGLKTIEPNLRYNSMISFLIKVVKTLTPVQRAEINLHFNEIIVFFDRIQGRSTKIADCLIWEKIVNNREPPSDD